MCLEQILKFGDALDSNSYDFSEPAKIIIYFNIKDLGFNKVQIFIEKNEQGKIFQKTFIIDFVNNDEMLKQKFKKLFDIFSLSNQNNIIFCAEKLNNKMKFMNAFFNKYFNKKIQVNSSGFIEI